jgi:hypothetical protein
MPTKLKQGDIVVSLGDQWIVKGSEGIVRGVKSDYSVLVYWDRSKTKKKNGVSLYHRTSALKLLRGAPLDPNHEFKMRKTRRFLT